ncbi:MAG TPA: hypothetical protein VFP84_31470 [Kofleriaceae bacterium]|nr:hypothetical protein [Kofleriaceae bacterium]
MTPRQRRRHAAPVVAAYWLVLLVGLGVVTADRSGTSVAAVAPLWFGAVVGTVVGQFLALRNLRLWLVALIVAAAAYVTLPMLAFELGGFLMWKVLIPAALCGYWCLGDRTALIAFWFPTVVWMPAILDRTQTTMTPDRAGLALLGVLAVGLFAFLRARESRRVALWRAVSAQPLAKASAPALLRQPPGQAVARASWLVTITAVTAAITAWLAPLLWRLEPVRGEEIDVPELVDAPLTDGVAVRAVPCCPRVHRIEIERARVKDYLDLGLGHDAASESLGEDGPACRACGGLDVASTGEITGELAGDAPIEAAQAAEATLRAPVGMPTPTPTPIEPVPVPVPVESTPRAAAVGITLPPAVESTPPRAPVESTARPSSIAITAPPSVVAPTPPPPAVTPPPGPTMATSAPPPAPAPTVTTPSVPPEAVPAPAPHADPHPDAPRAPAVHHRAPITWWPWLVTLAAGALIFPLVTLGLRPVRRLVTLRHLRRPLWDETVDQRVSNAWQLALIGLRDAGWRPDAGEAPRELAARVGIAGVEPCAVILERARHGLGIDAGDLAEVQRQADVAYAAARAPLGAVARTVAWLRWPLV